MSNKERAGISRRTAMKGAGALAVAGGLAAPALAQVAGSDKPIRIGFQVHRTGIGAA